MDFEKLMREKGKCCVTDKPLTDTAMFLVIDTDMKASWTYPIAGNAHTNDEAMAVAVVHTDAIADGLLVGPLKSVVEITVKGDIIYHDYKQRVCKVCGCSQFNACIHPKFGPCHWVAEDLCSNCKDHPGESKLATVVIQEQKKAAAEKAAKEALKPQPKK